MRDGGNQSPPFARSESPGGVPIGGELHLQYRSTLVGTQMVRALRVATVIIDVDDAEGQSLASVSDFAAMVGLAEVRPTDPPPAGSVLSLFAKDGARELTPLDLRFPTTIYKPLDRTALAHRGLLVRGLTNAAVK